MLKIILKPLGILLLAIGFFISIESVLNIALAADSASNFHVNILNEIGDTFRITASTWADKLKGYALSLFWMLASISLTWTAIELALKHAEFGEIVGELAKYIIFTGLFVFLLESGPYIAGLIFETFSKLGGIGAGLGTGSSGLPTMSPSDIVDVGLDFYEKTTTTLSWMGIGTAFCSLIQTAVAIVFFIFCLIIAIKVLVQIISLWCYMYAGAFLLGFGGSRWHRDIAINYFKGVLHASVKYFAMLFIIAIMRDLMTNLLKDMSFEQPIAMLQALALPIIFYMIMETVPDMIAGIVSGKFDFSSGPAASAVAGAMAGGLAGTATSLAVGGAAAGHATASAARGASKTIDYMANHSVSDGMKDLGKAISQSSPAQAGKAALSAGAKNLGQIAKAGSNVSKAGAKAGASLAKGATQGSVRGMSATAGFAKESLSHPIKTGSAAKSALKNTGISAGKAALSAGKAALSAGKAALSEGKNAVQSMATSASEMGKSAKSAFNSASAGIKSAVNQNVTQPYQAGAKAAQSFQAGTQAAKPNQAETQATEQNTDSQHDKGK